MTTFSRYYWYLIQRVQSCSRPDRAGVDSLLRHDYMGSAEFEFGSVPSSWKKLREAVASGKFLSIVHPTLRIRGRNGEPCQVSILAALIGTGHETSDILDALSNLAAMKIPTKDSTYFDPADETRCSSYTPDGWIAVSESDRAAPVFFSTDPLLFTAVLEELRNPQPTRPDGHQPRRRRIGEVGDCE